MEQVFEKRTDASTAAALEISRRLEASTTQGEESTLIVSGGTSPVQCFETLSRQALDWEKVHVTLSDERWTPADGEDSNERLVRETLLVDNARSAQFHPFYRDGDAIDSHCDALDEEIRKLPRPFACTLLGMGTDGHFASLFPDAENLEHGLDITSDRYAIVVDTAASPYRRLSLTLSAILQSQLIVLLMFGDEKRDVFERVKSGQSNLPVSHLVQAAGSKLQLFWAP